MSALGVALLGEVKKRPEAVGHIAKHTEALRREVLEVRPQEITVLVQQISRRQEGSVAAERGAVEEAGRDLRAETKGRPHRLVVDDLGSDWHGYGPRRSAIAATDIVCVAAGAIGAHRFLPVVEADKGADHEVAAIANLEVLTDIQGGIDQPSPSTLL